MGFLAVWFSNNSKMDSRSLKSYSIQWNDVWGVSLGKGKAAGLGEGNMFYKGLFTDLGHTHTHIHSFIHSYPLSFPSLSLFLSSLFLHFSSSLPVFLSPFLFHPLSLSSFPSPPSFLPPLSFFHPASSNYSLLKVMKHARGSLSENWIKWYLWNKEGYLKYTLSGISVVYGVVLGPLY